MSDSHASPELQLVSVVDALCEQACGLAAPVGGGRITLPSREIVLRCVEGIRAVFFPGYFGETELSDEHLHYYIGAKLDRALHALEEQVRRGVAFAERHDFQTCAHCGEAAAAAIARFAARLPEVRRLVDTDVDAAYDGDPALKIRDEAIFSYPGILAVTNQRLAHELYAQGVPIIPRMITEHAHALTGIDIHPGARIGERFFIDHGTGVVIGETAVIGANVRVYQGVTLGARSFPKDEHGTPIKGIDRHPIVEDDVVIYSGATILGRVVIGRGSSIGGNVWLTHGVPPDSRVTQAAVREQGWENGGGI